MKYLQNQDPEVKSVLDVVRENNFVNLEISNFVSSELNNKFLFKIDYFGINQEGKTIENELIQNDYKVIDILRHVREKLSVTIDNQRELILNLREDRNLTDLRLG